MEASNVALLSGDLEVTSEETPSGKGQDIKRCNRCKTAVWSHYNAMHPAIAFVRCGTLDDPDRCPPDVHIQTASAVSWPGTLSDAPRYEGFYNLRETWSEKSLKRFAALQASR